MNKKAQSQIITTVLIILLVLAAIVIVWQVVRKTTEESSGQISGTTKCINVGLEIKNVVGDTVTVSRSSQGGDIDGIRIIVDGTKDGTDRKTDILRPLETREYTLKDTTPTEKVQVAAIIDGSPCSIADTYEIGGGVLMGCSAVTLGFVDGIADPIEITRTDSNSDQVVSNIVFYADGNLVGHSCFTTCSLAPGETKEYITQGDLEGDATITASVAAVLDGDTICSASDTYTV